MQDFTALLKQEIVPALGCTEPIAVALAVARATEELGDRPERIALHVSRNILKNAMNVGIPGTGMKGLEIAAALAAVAGHSAYGLEVLRDETPDDVLQAKELRSRVSVYLSDVDKPLYIKACVSRGNDTAECVIEDSHTGITSVSHNSVSRPIEVVAEQHESAAPTITPALDLESIYEFATQAPIDKLAFLKRGMDMNLRVAREGLEGDYGMNVGRKLYEESPAADSDYADYAVALAAAAADARMGGCTLPVMSTAGSGNQGLAATLPCIAVAERLGASDEVLLRAEAISHLITIHIKSHIGKLSALCGCAIAASVGSSCGITYLLGGGLAEICFAVQNMIADISGLICDGAKAGCALKLATGVGAAVQCARLAIAGSRADSHDGIVTEDVERSIANLGELGARGMMTADKVILEMMMCK